MKLDKSIVQLYNRTREIRKTSPLCRAPFSNLYFSKNGDILACCFNRESIVGKYPEMALEEIWNGKKIKCFQCQIKSNELPKGCEICENELKSKNFMAVIARRMDGLKIKSKFPTSLEFELDNTCNLECIMCEGIFSSAIRKNRENKPPIKSVYNESFVDYISPFLKHAEIIRFGGGEPFLINLYYKIWDRFLEINSKGTIFIQTNGTVINDRIRNYLKTGRFTLGVSLDSMIEKHFEEIRVNANFENVIANIEEFHNLIPENSKYSRLMFSITMTRNNWKDIPDVINYAGKLGIQIGLNVVWTPEEYALFNLPSKYLNEILSFYKEIKLPAGDSWIFGYNSNLFHGHVKQIEKWYNINLEKEKIFDELNCKELIELKKIIFDRLDSNQININLLEKFHQLMENIESFENYKQYLIEIVLTPIETIVETLEKQDIGNIIGLLQKKLKS